MTANQGLEDDLFAFLCHKYVQRQDDRQKAMGLQYTTAETHDLARTLTAYFIGRIDASFDIAKQTMSDDDKRMAPLRARAAEAGITVRQIDDSDKQFAGKWFAKITTPGKMSEEIGPCHAEDQALLTALGQVQKHG